jgi:hypothetical protein
MHVDTEDVLIHFAAVGDTLTSSAWRPGGPRPNAPQISLVDTDYDLGTPAIFANPFANGQGIYRFINVSVPEPTSALLMSLGFLSMLPRRRRNSP